MSKHTPTPWREYGYSDRSNMGAPILIHSESQAVKNSGTAIVSVYGSENSADLQKRADERDANARHIVHCVNHHDELVAALEAVQQAQRSGTYAEAFAAVDAILAKVKGGA